MCVQTKHYDADERFMSTKDLMDQLRLVSGALDVPLQQPVRDAILRLLDDKNSDVSTMAVKCLSQLCQKFANEQIVYIVDKLADIIVDPTKAASRDVVTDGLQTMIASMPEEAGAHIAPKLIVSLLRGITKPPGEEIDCEMAALTVIKNVRAHTRHKQAAFCALLLSGLHVHSFCSPVVCVRSVVFSCLFVSAAMCPISIWPSRMR